MTYNTLSVFNSNLKHGEIQLKMDFNLDIVVENDLKLLVLQKLVEEMDLSFIVDAYSVKGRKPLVDPITMFKILIYCYSEGVRTSREIEKMCKYDLRILYLLEGKKSPDHSTIKRFRNKLAPLVEKILYLNNQYLLENDFLDASSIYIDGTKIEANSNKYTFVWKKSVIKFKNNLLEKIAKYLKISDFSDEKLIIKALKEEKQELRDIIKSQKIEFVFGKGKRKSKIKKDYEFVEYSINKIEEYNNHLEIMGERNSYSKTDHDATFMRMKDDHM